MKIFRRKPVVNIVVNASQPIDGKAVADALSQYVARGGKLRT